MDILYLLIPLSLVLVFVIAGLFWWSLQSGQYEDLEGPGHRILMDDDNEYLPADQAPVAAAPGDDGTGRSDHGQMASTVDSDQSVPGHK